jgi:RNA polymerase sigma-70 factor (ECF subfamily)
MNEYIPDGSYPLMRAPKAAPVEVQAENVSSSSSAESFQELFLEHWGMIYQLLDRMIGDPAEAEDLAMETFFRLYHHPPRTGEGSNLRGWLFRVATNLGLHSIRSYQRRQNYELAAGKASLENPSRDQPAEILDGREANRLVRLALGRMQPRQAQLLSLRYAGISYNEIARSMGLAPSSIGPLLLRAEREFAKIYRSLSPEEV